MLAGGPPSVTLAAEDLKPLAYSDMGTHMHTPSQMHTHTMGRKKEGERNSNEKCTLKDLEYGEKTENHGK